MARRLLNKTDIQPTYRIVTPGVCATSEKMGQFSISSWSQIRGACGIVSTAAARVAYKST